MKLRPINFKAHEVRAIREGRKTQTRRVVSHPLALHAKLILGPHDGEWWDCVQQDDTGGQILCPYGQPGDRLYVKERWMNAIAPDGFSGAPQVKRGPKSEKLDGWIRVAWHSDSPDPGGWPIRYGWKSPVTMPRWASRITLEIVSVRVERLQDISEEDAKAEGVIESYRPSIDPMGLANNYTVEFFKLWESINGPGSLDLNPWVWVVEFKEVK